MPFNLLFDLVVVNDANAFRIKNTIAHSPPKKLCRKPILLMLVNDLDRHFGAGIDLTNFEVKLAKRRSSYEYQYHKATGRAKLLRDMEVGHLFFDYANNLRDVDLRYAHGSQLRSFFEVWLRDYPDPYQQRYRKNVGYTWVKMNSVLVMTLADGEVVFPKLTIEEPPKSVDGDEKPPEAAVKKEARLKALRGKKKKTADET